MIHDSKLAPRLGVALLLLLVLVLWFVWPSASPKDPAIAGATGAAAATASAPMHGPASTQRHTALAPLSREAALDSRASTAPSTPALASLLVNVIWKQSRAPAEGIAVTLFPGDSTYMPGPAKSTNVRGHAEFDALAPGNVLALSDRGAFAEVDLVAGSSNTCTIELPDGITIEGTVVDWLEAPVAEANLWLMVSHEHSRRRAAPYSWRRVATSDRQGRFRLQGLKEFQGLVARKSGYAPSAWTVLGPPQVTGVPTSVTLVLPSRGAALKGYVHDGIRPIAEARLTLWLSTIVDTSYAGTRGAPQSACRTDREGRFALDDLPEGTTIVFTSADAYVWNQQTCKLTPGTTAELDIQLAPAAIITGRVRDAEQRVLADVRVIAVGTNGSHRSESASLSDGSYRLDSAPRGCVTLTFSKRGYRDQRQVLDTPIDTSAPVTCDVVLQRAPQLRGRIQDEAKQPLARWRVEAFTGDGPRRSRFFGETDEQGKFVIAATPGMTYTVALSEPKTHQRITCKDNPPLVTDGPEVTITIHDRQMPSAFVIGKLVDESGAHLPGAGLLLRDSFGPLARALEQRSATDGTFRIGRLPPGGYTIYTSSPDVTAVPPADLATFELGPNQELDLGSLRVPRGRRLIFRFVDREGQEIQGISGTILDEQRGWMVTCAREQGHGEAWLLPGRYRFFAHSEDWTTSDVSVEIHPERDTRITLAFTRAVSRHLQIVLPANVVTEDGEAVDLVVLMQNGHVYRREHWPVDPGDPISIAVWLPIGVHRVEVSLSTGQKLTGSIENKNLTPTQDLMRVELTLVR